MVLVGEQREVQRLAAVELLDRLDRVRGDAEHDRAERVVVRRVVADAARLRGAAGRVGLGVEVQDHRAAGELRQRASAPSWSGSVKSGAWAPSSIISIFLSLEQPGQAAVLQHAALRLAFGAVAHHVVLVEDGLEHRLAARARLALVGVDARGLGELLGQRELDLSPRRPRSRGRARSPSPRPASPASSALRSSPRLNGESRAACRISSTQVRPMPAITCWSRSSECSGRGEASRSREVRRRFGPGLGAERAAARPRRRAPPGAAA